MALKDSLRLESIYFNNLKSMMKMLKSWADGTTDEKTKDIIENCIQADAAILLLYRNLGEAWNELMANIQKEMHDLQDLKETVDAYHDELNEKIDEVNNYLMVLIRELQERVTILEGRVDVLETQINIILDLVEDEPVQAKRGKKNTKAANDPTYHLEYHGETVDYSDIEEMVEAGLDRVIWVRAKEELCHMRISEENVITFDRTFYDETTQKFYKESVTIDSSNSVTYSLDEVEIESGGSSIYEIEFRYNDDDPSNPFYEVYHDDILVTVQDIYDAINSKKQIIGYETLNGYSYKYYIEYDSMYFEESPTYTYVSLTFKCSTIYFGNNSGLRTGLYKYFELSCESGIDEGTQEYYESLTVSKSQFSDHVILLSYKSQGVTDIINGPISGFKVDYIEDFVNAFAYFTHLPNPIGFVYYNPVRNSNCILFNCDKLTGYVDNVVYQGIKVDITDLTFTNNSLNTRTIFLYENGVADYTPI